MQDKEEEGRMFEHIEQWRASEQSQMSYCKEAGLAYHRFHYWYKRYRKEKQNDQEVPSAFVALQVQPADTFTAPYAELIVPNGKRLVLYHSVETALLQALLH